MLDWQKHKKLRVCIKTICVILIASFLSYDLVWAGAAEILSPPNLPSLHQIPFAPPTLKYLSVNQANPYNYFNFLLDKGQVSILDKDSLNKEARQLINYFFLGITLPDDAFWVNLKPQEPERITSEQLSKTDLGRILLEQDFRLKRDMSQYLNPKNSVGRQFWEKLYSILGKDKVKKASINTSNRVWIVPEEAVVLETEDGALLARASLKVLLESEYAALENNKFVREGSSPFANQESLNKFSPGNNDSLQALTEQLMKEIIIPAITKDVNESKNYAPLRQIYHSLILTQWFKRRHKNANSTYSQAINKEQTQGLELELPWQKDRIYQEYLKSYQQGEYNIKDTIFGLKRMYFSGGVVFNLGEVSSPLVIISQKDLPKLLEQAPDFLNKFTGHDPFKDELVVLTERTGNQEDPAAQALLPDIKVVSSPRNLVKEETALLHTTVLNELTHAQQLANLFRNRTFDEQVQAQALAILDVVLKEEGLGFSLHSLRRKFLQVTRQLFLRPDTKAQELIQQFGLTKDELIDIYRILRLAKPLQDLIVNESEYAGFVIHEMINLLRYSDRLEKIFNNQIVYPIIVEWHPGEKCDSNCIFCFNRGMHYKDKEQSREPLSLERTKELLQEFVENGVREFWVSGGKEPLTNPITTQVIQFATDLGLIVKLYTNGIRLDRAIQERILGCKQVRISLNAATPQTYQLVQGINSDNFKKVVKNIGNFVRLKKQKNANIRIGMSFLLTPHNYKEILKIAELAKELGVDFLSIRTEMVGTIRRFNQEEVKEILRLVEALKVNQELGHYDGLDLDVRSVTEKDLLGEKRYLPGMEGAKTCRVRMIKMGMSPYGVCYMCEYAEHPRNAKPELEIGDVTKMSFREVLEHSIQIQHDSSQCEACTINEYGVNIVLEKLKEDRDFGISLEDQPYAVEKEREIPHQPRKVDISKKQILEQMEENRIIDQDIEKPIEQSDSFLAKTDIANNSGGIDLSSIELTLKDEKFLSSLNPADLKILHAAKALKQGWDSLAVLYVHEVRLLLKHHIFSKKDITQRVLLENLLIQLQHQELLDQEAMEFCRVFQRQAVLPQERIALVR